MARADRIERLLDILFSVPEGKMLVDLARAHEMKIFFDGKLAEAYLEARM